MSASKPREVANIEAYRMLLADWFARIGIEAGLPLTNQSSSDSFFTLGDPNQFHVTAKFQAKYPHLKFGSSDPARQAEINALVAQALAQVESNDFGAPIWYSVALTSNDFKVSPQSGLGGFVHQLFNQVRIVGWRRLDPRILLEFTEEPPTDTQEVAVGIVPAATLAPRAIINVHLSVPAPRVGRFSAYMAHSAVETIAAICTLALQRSVGLPLAVQPTRAELVAQLTARASDPSIGILAKDSIRLDIFDFLRRPGGLETYNRLRAALLTYDAAMHQRHDSIACLLYVVSAEALVCGDPTYKTKRVLARFRDYYEQLMPAKLDEQVAHANFEMLFKIQRGSLSAERLRKRLLDAIYSFRSAHVHEGLRPKFYGFTVAHDMEDVRRSFLADFAESAILATITAPLSSLIGTPLDPKREAGNCPVCAVAPDGTISLWSFVVTGLAHLANRIGLDRLAARLGH